MKYSTQTIQKLIKEHDFTVLYVEDEPNIAQLLQDTIQSIVNKVYVAHNGQEGLELYKQINPDIVITDIVMPKMNGIVMAQHIKNINPKQSILITTAFGDKQYMHEAIKLKVDGFVEKPIDIDYFCDSIYKILENKILKYELEKKEIIIFEQYKNLAMKDMLSNIAHQWRQPLSAISIEASSIGYALESNKIDKNTISHQVNSIVKHTQQLSSIIEIFNDLATNNRDEKKHIDLKDTIFKVKTIIDEKLKAHNIDLLLDIDENIYSLIANQNVLSKVFLNIVKNAKESLLEKDKPNKWVKIALFKKDHYGVITIEDNGIGLPIDGISRIFEAYYTTKHQAQGKGLGLFMCYDIIVEEYGGNIYGKNTQNGALITIELPIES